MRKLACAVVLLVAVSGCAGDLPPRSLLQDLRVLALLANPLEAGPGDEVSVSAYTLPPPGATVVEETWSFCPFTVGATASDVCAVPACETPLVPAGGVVTADPGALALACAGQYGGAPAGGGAVPSQVPDRLEVLFRYRAAASDGSTREAVLRVPLYPRGAPADRNQRPIVTSVSIAGQAMPLAAAPAGGGPVATAPAVPRNGQLEIRVSLDPSSEQQYQDSSGRTVSEQLFVSFYTTDGRFDYDRGVGLDESVNLKDDKVASRATPALVWAVAHDDRGGATVLGPYAVPFTP